MLNFENDPKTASKVVDKNGSPLILYHGTNSDILDFDTEKSSECGIGSGLGAFFTSNINYANDYANEQGGNIIPVFLSIKNPLIIDDYYGIDEICRIASNYEAVAKYGKTIHDLEHSKFESDHEKAIAVLNMFYQAPSSDFFTYKNAKVKKILLKIGYDGLILIGDKQCNSKNDIVAVAFKPCQIKSSIGNNGNFDKANNGIIY